MALHFLEKNRWISVCTTVPVKLKNKKQRPLLHFEFLWQPKLQRHFMTVNNWQKVECHIFLFWDMVYLLYILPVILQDGYANVMLHASIKSWKHLYLTTFLRSKFSVHITLADFGSHDCKQTSNRISSNCVKARGLVGTLHSSVSKCKIRE